VNDVPSTATAFRDEELLADVITRLIGDVRHIAVGNASPIPAMAALLARQRGRGMPYVSLLQSRKHNFFTDCQRSAPAPGASPRQGHLGLPAGREDPLCRRSARQGALPTPGG
jgi:hypothetical protein